MNRRIFLKGLFVAAVTPASCVRVLYEIKSEPLTTEQLINKAIAHMMKDIDLSEYIVDNLFCCGIANLDLKPFSGIEWTNFAGKNYVFDYQPPKRRS